MMGLTQLSPNTGGDKLGMRIKYIGLIRVSCVARRRKEEWTFEVSTLSTWPCWLNKNGDLLRRHILCSTGCIRQGTSPIALLWKLN